MSLSNAKSQIIIPGWICREWISTASHFFCPTLYSTHSFCGIPAQRWIFKHSAAELDSVWLLAIHHCEWSMLRQQQHAGGCSSLTGKQLILTKGSGVRHRKRIVKNVDDMPTWHCAVRQSLYSVCVCLQLCVWGKYEYKTYPWAWA